MPKHDIDPSFLERMHQAWERRQDSLASARPKSLFDITKDLRKNMYNEAKTGAFTEGKMLKAIAKRFAGQNHVVGNTVFSFDKDGLTQVIDAGYSKYDFEALCSMNGVYVVQDESKKAPVAKDEDKEPKDEPKKAEVQDKSPKSMAKEGKDGKDSGSNSDKQGKAEKSEKSEK